MKIVLWDTRKLDASKDFAGGFGVGKYPHRGGLRNKVIRHFYTRDRRPVALLFAYLAAIFGRLGHRVYYAENRIPKGADLYVFCPSLITLDIERQAMARAAAENPGARALVVGLVASVMPEAFDGLGVTVVRGEAEQLMWRLDEVLGQPSAVVHLGTIDELDSLPPPNWSPFGPRRFRIGYDFWRFPTALIQASRGCTFRCNYCPYIIQDNSTRFRSPEAIVDEIRHDVRHWGFRSFKFRDPLFGLNRRQVLEMAERISRLPRRIQFSIETRIELVPPEVLRVLKRAGLTSITVGVETPSNETLRKYRRSPVREDRQREFVAVCRRLGIRTVAGFMIGFPEDTKQSIRGVFHYATMLNPTFANFNVVTPYPGTEFFEEIKEQIADFDFSHYSVYTPVLKYRQLSAEAVSRLHAQCFQRFYFRWGYLWDNAHLLWPFLQRFGIGRRPVVLPVADRSAEEVLRVPPSEGAHAGVPKPLSAVEVLERRGLRQDGPHRYPGAAEPPIRRR